MNAATMKDTAKQSFEMYKSAFESAFRYQEKLSKGVEVFANLDYDDINKTPKDLVFQIDKMKLYHYRPLVKNPLAVPVMITYALMNKQYIMDIQQDKSFVKRLLELGLDLYIVD